MIKMKLKMNYQEKRQNKPFKDLTNLEKKP